MKEARRMYRNILENAKPKDLFDFLEEYAKLDEKFKNALHVRFSAPDFEDDLHKVRVMIDNALDAAVEYGRHDSWGWMKIDTSEIIFEIKQRAKQGNVKLAFAELEILYRKLIELFECQSECEVNDEAESVLQMIADVAKKATDPHDKEYIFEHCIDLAKADVNQNFGAENEDQLLNIATQFVTDGNRKKLEDALDECNARWRKDRIR
jgi:hypothetical protein